MTQTKAENLEKARVSLMAFAMPPLERDVAEMLVPAVAKSNRRKGQFHSTNSLSYLSTVSSASGTVVTKLESSSDDSERASRVRQTSRGTYRSIADADLHGRVVVAENGAKPSLLLSLLSSVTLGMNAVRV